MAKTKMKVYGFQEFLDQLVKAGNSSGKVIGKALYAGADVAADELRAQTEALPTDSGQTKSKGGHHVLRDCTSYEKKGLLDNLGTAKARNEGDARNISIGFDGYNGHATERWPNGVPNVVVARSLQSGTSFMRRNDFIARAARNSKSQAEQAMKEAAEAEMQKSFE